MWLLYIAMDKCYSHMLWMHRAIAYNYLIRSRVQKVWAHSAQSYMLIMSAYCIMDLNAIKYVALRMFTNWWQGVGDGQNWISMHYCYLTPLHVYPQHYPTWSDACAYGRNNTCTRLATQRVTWAGPAVHWEECKAKVQVAECVGQSDKVTDSFEGSESQKQY